MLKQAMAGYIGADLLVTPNYRGGSNNGVMYTGEFIVILNRLGELTDEERHYWRLAMTNCEISPGLIKRSPTNDRDNEGPDDYHGYLAAAKHCDPQRAKNFLAHGYRHFGFYDSNGRLEIKDFMWRFPQLIVQARMAAGLRCFTSRLFFILPLMYHYLKAVPTSDTDARRLGWLLIQTWDGKGFFSKLAVRLWGDKLLKDYPNGMRDVAGIYYERGHPFAAFIPKL